MDHPHESPLVWGHPEVTLEVLSTQAEEGLDDHEESPMALCDDPCTVPYGNLPNAQTLFFGAYYLLFRDKTHGEEAGRHLWELVHEVIVEGQACEPEDHQVGVFSLLVGR